MSASFRHSYLLILRLLYLYLLSFTRVSLVSHHALQSALIILRIMYPKFAMQAMITSRLTIPKAR
jgi:hypothetical protein